ncbi:mannose-6-phosphate isomerase, class I [Nakamurella flavida]|uniref:mannose-6-phosphate isomerase n=2 Tax=Nakamurella flavida TaxID=363630 RepID=A0A938YKK9_9ACTN|nr:mannose-6-phosphate isomerase, class I [Nakamurella flavida]
MRNRIRPYAWGSRTALAELLGEPNHTGEPQAELWIGAHPDDPSMLVCEAPTGADSGTHSCDAAGTSLAQAIQADPHGTLGSDVAARFGARLPFLLKVLAVAAPLSLQAHPSVPQAKAGYAREEAAGVPLDAGHRNYKDEGSKPEMICALTRFEALCGFRKPAQTVELMTALVVPRLQAHICLLASRPDARGLRAMFGSFLSLDAAVRAELIREVVVACARKVREEGPFAAEYRTAIELAEQYPGDAGVLISLMLNRIVLAPGEALYVPDGNLHAYLSGTGVEIMANSDNVLRGGLTGKHVDVPELTSVMDFTASVPAVLRPVTRSDAEYDYPNPAGEFQLSRLELDGTGPVELGHEGPQIVLVIRGELTAHHEDGTTVTVRRGQSLWIPATDSGVTITGDAIAFRATDGLSTMALTA